MSVACLFRPEAKKEYTTNKQATKTMGRATVNTHDPNEFLRRTKQNELASCEEKTFKYTDRNKAPLPDFKNIEYKPSVSSKNFIKKVRPYFKVDTNEAVIKECNQCH